MCLSDLWVFLLFENHFISFCISLFFDDKCDLICTLLGLGKKGLPVDLTKRIDFTLTLMWCEERGRRVNTGYQQTLEQLSYLH